jgi:hypothetical protein
MGWGACKVAGWGHSRGLVAMVLAGMPAGYCICQSPSTITLGALHPPWAACSLSCECGPLVFVCRLCVGVLRQGWGAANSKWRLRCTMCQPILAARSLRHSLLTAPHVRLWQCFSIVDVCRNSFNGTALAALSSRAYGDAWHSQSRFQKSRVVHHCGEARRCQRRGVALLPYPRSVIVQYYADRHTRAQTRHTKHKIRSERSLHTAH